MIDIHDYMFVFVAQGWRGGGGEEGKFVEIRVRFLPRAEVDEALSPPLPLAKGKG